MAVCTAEVIFGWIEERIFYLEKFQKIFYLEKSQKIFYLEKFQKTWIEERICAIRASWEAAELLLVDDKPLRWKECSNPAC